MIQSGLTKAAKRAMLGFLAERKCKVALYTQAAAVGPDSPAYTPEGETSGNGYTAGGADLINPQVVGTSTGAAITWQFPTWKDATFKARGLMIYIDDLPGKPALVVADFGAEKIVENSPFSATPINYPIELD